MSLFLAGEGGDGSGKATQMKLLFEYSQELGFSTEMESFPRYSNPVTEPIKRFLNGRYGNPHPELASVPYALDRLDGSTAIKEQLAKPLGVYLADRFTSSNQGHNGSKFDDPAERADYFEYTRHFEHEVLGIPKPDLNVILLVTPEISQANIDKKAKRDYTEKTRDIHEADINHLARTRMSYIALADLYPNEYKLIDCMATETTMRTIEDIQDELRSAFRSLAIAKGML